MWEYRRPICAEVCYNTTCELTDQIFDGFVRRVLSAIDAVAHAGETILVLLALGSVFISIRRVWAMKLIFRQLNFVPKAYLFELS